MTADRQPNQIEIKDFPVALCAVLGVLFIISWILALFGETGFKPVHFTLFNFLLVAIFGLQKYRCFRVDLSTGLYELRSFGLLSGRSVQTGDWSLIQEIKVESGIGGMEMGGGRLIARLPDQTPLILANTDLFPGSHKKLLKWKDQLDSMKQEASLA